MWPGGRKVEGEARERAGDKRLIWWRRRRKHCQGKLVEREAVATAPESEAHVLINIRLLQKKRSENVIKQQMKKFTGGRVW